MEPSGSKVMGFTPGKLIPHAGDEKYKFPKWAKEMRMEDEEEKDTPIITISNEGVSVRGQIVEADVNEDRKRSTLNDVRHLVTSAWENATTKDLLSEKDRKARKELHARDQNAVEYSKSLLDEGDTLVYVSYPGGITFYNTKGDPQPYKIYRVSSEKLKALGSSKFSRMFEERQQYWARKRKGLLHHLPDRIKYVLDLTPSEEGDEAVELVSELSCSAGIRNWYLAEKHCGVEKQLVAGDDDVPRPAIIPAKAAEQFRLRPSVNGYLGQDFDPSSPTIDWSSSQDEYVRTSLGRMVPKDQTANNPGGGNPVEYFQTQRAIKNSLDNHVATGLTGNKSKVEICQDLPKVVPPWELKKEVLDYCPIRHRFGVENLLRIIQGKVPKLDSAPKVWTLFVLAKYYECTGVVIDYVTSWIMNGSNIKFLEILPEASLNIGLGLNIPMITRAAFSILVSEEALNVASRPLCVGSTTRREEYKYVRPREELDEDLWNVIQHASQDFCDRIQKTITDLLDDRMLWFVKLPEYKNKICKFEEYCYKKKYNGKMTEALYERRMSIIQNLLVNLREFVRGRIVMCLNQGLSAFDITETNKLQRQLQLEVFGDEPQVGPDFNYIYNGLGHRERVLLPYFWSYLRDLNWNDCPSMSARLHSYNPQLLRSEKGLIDRESILFTTAPHFSCFAKDFNREVDLAVRTENYYVSPYSNSAPTIPPVKSKSMDEEIPNYAFMSAYNQDHAYHQARLAGIKALELELAGYDGTIDDAASMSSVTTDASTKPLIHLPLRYKATVEDDVESTKNKFSLEVKVDQFTKAESSSNASGPKVLENFLGNLGRKPLIDYKEYKATAITKTSYPRLETDSLLILEDEEYLPYDFNVDIFMRELQHYIVDICNSMLSKPDGSEFTMLTDTLLCLTDNEWQYLPLWAGGNDDGSGGVTSADVPPAYYSNVGGLTPGVQYKGVAGFVGVGSSVNTSLDVRDGSARTVTMAGSDADGDMNMGSEHGSEAGLAGDSDAGSVFSTESYDMAVMTPMGSGSESEFEIVSGGEDEESGDELTIAGDSISDMEMEMSDREIVEENMEKVKGKGKEKEVEENDDEDEDDMDWTNQEDLEDDWEGSFTDD